MKLSVIGAGPAYTDRPGAVGSSYLVSSGTTNLLLDLGHGAFSNLAGRIEPSTLSLVAISHLHPDHFVDLVPLNHYLHYQFQPTRRLTILAPAHLAERLDGLLGQPGFSAGIFDLEPLADGLVRTVGELRLEAHRVTHTDDSYAFRISAGSAAAGGAATGDGPGLVYSGDCGRADDLRPLLHPGDCLLSEVSFGLDPVPAGAQHISAADVAGVARDGAAGRILLTHLMSGRDRAAVVAAVERFSGGIPTRLVDPGDTFEL